MGMSALLRSMTGYGRNESTVGGHHITFEIKAVNHKYFEFSSRVTRGYLFLEEKLKSAGVEFALMSIGINNSDAAKNHLLVHKTDEINQGLLKLISRTAFVKALRR